MKKQMKSSLKIFKKTYEFNIKKLKKVDQNIPIFIRGFREINLQVLGNQLLGNKLDDTSSFIDITSKDLKSNLTLSFNDIISSNTGTINSSQLFKGVYQFKNYNKNSNILLWPCNLKNQEIDNEKFLANVINQSFAQKIFEKSQKAKIVMLVDAQNQKDNYLEDILDALKKMFKNQQNFNQSQDSILLYICNIQNNDDLNKMQQQIDKIDELKNIKQVHCSNFIININDDTSIQNIKNAIEDITTTQKLIFENLEGNFEKSINEYYQFIRNFVSEYYQCGNRDEEDKYQIEINEIQITKGCMLLLEILNNFGQEKAKKIYKDSCQIFKEHYKDFKNFIQNEIKEDGMDEESYNDLYEEYLKEFVLMVYPYLKDFKIKKDLINFDKQIRQDNFNNQIEYSFDDNSSSNSNDQEQNNIKEMDSFEDQKFELNKQDKEDLMSDHEENQDEDEFQIIGKDDDESQFNDQNQNFDENNQAQVEHQYLIKTREQDRLHHKQLQLEKCYNLCQQYLNAMETQQEQQRLKQQLQKTLKMLEIKYMNDQEKLKEVLKQELDQNKQKIVTIIQECIKLYLQQKKLVLEKRNQNIKIRANRILEIYVDESQKYDEIIQKKKQIQQSPQKQLVQIIATNQNVNQFQEICTKLIEDKQNINKLLDDQGHSLLYNSILFEAKEIQKLLEEKYNVQFNDEDQKSINQNFCEAVKRFEYDAILVKIALGHNIDENFNCIEFEFNPSLLPPCEVTQEIDDIIDPLQKMIAYDDLNALDVAILQNNFKAVKIIVEKGNCQLNNEEKQYKLIPPLMISILTGNQEIFDYLYEKCDKNIKANQYNYNLAHIAILSSNVQVLQKLDQHYFMEQDDNGYLPLHLAVEISLDYDVFVEVLNKTESLNVLNNDEQNAATMAILNHDQLNLIKYLDYNELCSQWEQKTQQQIENSYFDETDLNQQLFNYVSKLDVILDHCRHNRNKTLDLFEKSDSKTIPYDYAILKGEIVVNKLIQFDEDTNNRLTEEQKKIYQGSREGFVKSFFEKPKVKRQINSGKLKNQIFQIVFDLYKDNIGEFSIEKEFRDEENNTFLHHLVEQNMVEIIKQQLNNKSDQLEKKNIYGETPLFIAVTLENEELIQVLLDKGADINNVNFEQQTPLIISIQNELFESAEFLMRQPQLDKTLKDKNEKTAEDYLDEILNNDYECMKQFSRAKAQNLKTKF